MGLVGIIMCVGLVGTIMCVGLVGTVMYMEFSRDFYVCGIQPDLLCVWNSAGSPIHSKLESPIYSHHETSLLFTHYTHAPISQHTYPKETTPIRNSTQTTESLSTVRIAQ